MKHRALTFLYFGLLAFFCMFTVASAETVIVPNPTIVGPIPVVDVPGTLTHNYPFFTPQTNLAKLGYVEEEFFVEGFARKYNTPTGATGSLVVPVVEYPYTTRIIVRRPISEKKFNGTVLLEWQNVTAGYDLDAMWSESHFTRSGYAWIGVSAQRVGIHGSPLYPVNQALRAWSPIRYGDLDVTVSGTVMDDSLCYEIYAQVIKAIKNPQGVDPMNGFKVNMVIAMGASQSASRLVVYLNSIHPLHELADAFYFLVGGYGTRTDLDVKVFQVVSETDVIGSAYRRIADSDRRRTWECAGAAHSGYWSAAYRTPIALRDGIIQSSTECTYPPLSRVHFHYVVNAAYDHLVQWVDKGIPPPTAQPLNTSSLGPPAVLVRNDLGLATGGIQLPDVAVPIALNNGTNSGTGTFCMLYGTYMPFDDETLRSLYRNHGSYVSAVTKATMDNLKDGYIVNADAQEIRDDSAHVNVPPK